MPKEEERKFLFNGTSFDVVSLGTEQSDKISTIKDYYLNEYTRVRYKYDLHCSKPFCYMCTKGSGTMIRDEYEYTLAEVPNISDFKCKPLVKKRYYVLYKGLRYEINVYEDINLILVELEGHYSNSYIESIKPEWLGEEVTEDKKFYNYNLWKQVNECTCV